MRTEAGAAGVIGAGLAALIIIMSLLVVDTARMVAIRAQLVTAADAAALAAAPVTFSAFGTDGDPVTAAAQTANANGAELVGCRCSVDRTWATRQVVVEVRVAVDLVLLGDRVVTASAAAEFQPIALAQR